MVKTFDAKTMLESVMYDAQTHLKQGDVKGAYALLKAKIERMEKMDTGDWASLRW